MTVITQYRLKCDYCGNVSPVWSTPDCMGDEARPPYPHGWTEQVIPPTEGQIREYILRSAQQVSPPYTPILVSKVYHFCTAAHKLTWQKQQAEQTA